MKRLMKGITTVISIASALFGVLFRFNPCDGIPSPAIAAGLIS